MIRRVPFMALQKAIYSLLDKGQTTPVYDDVPENAVLPYITLGEFTCKLDADKTNTIWNASISNHGWSDYAGKKEINTILDDVATVLSSISPDLSESNFGVIDSDIDFLEAFPEESTGYHGVITVRFKIQDKGSR